MEKGPSDDNVALVTGGYKNLGREISKLLKDRGYHVIATYRTDMKEAERTSKELGIEVHYADMSSPEDISSLFTHLRSRGLRVSVLVNNISSFPVGSLQEMDIKDLDDAYRSTFRSAYLTAMEALPDMRNIGWGRIINISMAGTSQIRAFTTVAIHASMKTALNVLTLSLAKELSGSGITVNGILPGIIDRPGMDENWRDKMKRVSDTTVLPTDIEVAGTAMKVIEDNDLNGQLLEVD